MKIRLLLCLVITILVIGVGISVPSRILPSAKAVTGQVCLGAPQQASTTNPCSSTPPVFTGNIGSLLKVGVLLQGSDATNGFDVTVKANHTVLRPIGVSLDGTLLPTPTDIIDECIQGHLVYGNLCLPTDTVDTVHLAVVGARGQVTNSPISGLLFTITYNVTGLGPTPISFQSGCDQGGTSVGDICITIASGAVTPDPENYQIAYFGSATQDFDFTLTASPNPAIVQVNTSAISTITVMRVRGFTGNVSLALSGASNRNCTLASTTISGGNGTTALSCRSTMPGSFGFYVTGNGGGIAHSLFVNFGFIPPPPRVPGVKLTANPNPVTGEVNVAATIMITVTPVNGFTGDVALTIPGTHNCSLSSRTIAGGNGTARLTCTAIVPESFGFYVIGWWNGSGDSSTVLVSFNFVSTMKDFSLKATPSSLTINSLAPESSQITAVPLNGLTGSISLSYNILPDSSMASCSLSLTSITLGTSESSTLKCSVTSTATGSFSVDIAGTNSTVTRHVPIYFYIRPDFSISAGSASLQCANSESGTSASTVINLTPANGYYQDLELHASVLPSNLTIVLSPATIIHGSGSSTMTVSCQRVPPGTYSVSVRATASYAGKTVTITVKVS